MFSSRLVIVSWCWRGKRQHGRDEPRPGLPVKWLARDSYLLEPPTPVLVLGSYQLTPFQPDHPKWRRGLIGAKWAVNLVSFLKIFIYFSMWLINV